MFNLDLLLAQIHNDEEALIIISALGVSIAEWPFIKSIGPLQALASDLFLNMIKKKLHIHPGLADHWSNLRKKLDDFYADQGFLCTPLLHGDVRLFKVPQAPLVFFGRFNSLYLDTSPQVAVVGARDACKRGLAWSMSLCARLAAHGINVISGGARGIDSHAHQGALEQGGTTCVVSGLSCDLSEQSDKIAKNSHHARMAIIYPFGPFFPQGKYMFVERNRYVAALADALIVVQGRKGSGTLHTVKFAEALNLPIYALPGTVDDPLSYVPNQLLQSGQAKAVADFDQIAQALMTNATKAPKKQRIAQEFAGSSLHLEPLPEVLMLIKNHGNSLSMSEILAFSGKSFLAMQKELLEFELEGRVIKQGSQFVLTGR